MVSPCLCQIPFRLIYAPVYEAAVSVIKIAGADKARNAFNILVHVEFDVPFYGVRLFLFHPFVYLLRTLLISGM